MPKIHTINLDGKIYNLGFKVVTMDLKSLGLRKNPNIITFPINDWYYLSNDEIVEGVGDYGGIWVARTLSGAKSLRKYILNKYNQETRIFKTALENILYSNSYRIKTNAVNMFEEINL